MCAFVSIFKLQILFNYRQNALVILSTELGEFWPPRHEGFVESCRHMVHAVFCVTGPPFENI